MEYRRYNYDIAIIGNVGDSWTLQVSNANFKLSKYNGTLNETHKTTDKDGKTIYCDYVKIIYYGIASEYSVRGTIELVENGLHCHSALIDNLPNKSDNFATASFFIERIVSDKDFIQEINESNSTLKGRLTYVSGYGEQLRVAQMTLSDTETIDEIVLKLGLYDLVISNIEGKKLTVQPRTHSIEYFWFTEENENALVSVSLLLPDVLDVTKTKGLSKITSLCYKKADFDLDSEHGYKDCDIECEYDDTVLTANVIASAYTHTKTEILPEGVSDKIGYSQYTLTYKFERLQPQIDFDYAYCFFNYLASVLNVSFTSREVPLVTELRVIPKDIYLHSPATSCTVNVLSVCNNVNVPYRFEIIQENEYFGVSGNTFFVNDPSVTNEQSCTYSISALTTDLQTALAITSGTFTYETEKPSSDYLQIYLDLGADNLGLDENDLTSPEWSGCTIEFSDDENVMTEGYIVDKANRTIYVDFTQTIGFKVAYIGSTTWKASLNNAAKALVELSTDISTSMCKIQLNVTEDTKGLLNRLYIETLEEDWHCNLVVSNELKEYTYAFQFDNGEKSCIVEPTVVTASEYTTFAVESTMYSKKSSQESFLNFLIPEYSKAYFSNTQYTNVDTLYANTVGNDNIVDIPEIKIDVYHSYKSGDKILLEKIENISGTSTSAIPIYAVLGDISKSKVLKANKYYLVVSEESISNANKNGWYYFYVQVDQNVSNQKLDLFIPYKNVATEVFWLVGSTLAEFYKDGNKTNGVTIPLYCIKNGTKQPYSVHISTDAEGGETYSGFSSSYVASNFTIKNPTSYTTSQISTSTTVNTGYTSGFTLYANPLSSTALTDSDFGAFPLEFSTIVDGTEVSSTNKDKVIVKQYNVSAGEETSKERFDIENVKDISLIDLDDFSITVDNVAPQITQSKSIFTFDLQVAYSFNKSTDKNIDVFSFNCENYSSRSEWTVLTNSEYSNYVSSIDLLYAFTSSGDYKVYDPSNEDLKLPDSVFSRTIYFKLDVGVTDKISGNVNHLTKNASVLQSIEILNDESVLELTVVETKDYDLINALDLYVAVDNINGIYQENCYLWSKCPFLPSTYSSLKFNAENFSYNGNQIVFKVYYTYDSYDWNQSYIVDSGTYEAKIKRISGETSVVNCLVTSGFTNLGNQPSQAIDNSSSPFVYTWNYKPSGIKVEMGSMKNYRHLTSVYAECYYGTKKVATTKSKEFEWLLSGTEVRLNKESFNRNNTCVWTANSTYTINKSGDKYYLVLDANNIIVLPSKFVLNS